MKKIIAFAIATSTILSIHAQSAKVVSARNYLNTFKKENDVDYLNKAKEAIDLAAEHPDTKDQAKTHYIRGMVYLDYFDYQLRTATEKQVSTIQDPKKREAAAYQSTPADMLDVAYQAYKKAKELDAKGNYSGEIAEGMTKISAFYNNKAAYDYGAKKFAESLASFEKAYEIDGGKDTNLLFNCALTAERSQNYEKAKTYYGRMIEHKQAGANAYAAMVDIYLNSKDTVGGMEWLKKGRVAYPNDINLLISETNYYLKTNRSKEALDDLNQAVASRPGSADLYLARAGIYDGLANPKDADGKDLEKPKDYNEKLKLAEADYKKAIELKPDYFDALYNLGVLYFNNGVNYLKMGEKITDAVKVKETDAKAAEEFNKAMAPLEKALEVEPKNRTTMQALSKIYVRLQLMDKYNAMKARMNNN